MSEKNIPLLDTLRTRGSNTQPSARLHQSAAARTRHSDDENQLLRGNIDRCKNICTFSAGADQTQNIASGCESPNLRCEELVVAIVVGNAAHQRTVCRHRNRQQGRSVKTQTRNKFGRELMRISQSSAVTQEKYFSASAKDLKTQRCPFAQLFLKLKVGRQFTMNYHVRDQRFVDEFMILLPSSIDRR